MSQKTVLVFGGSGTVGQGLIRVLLENGKVYMVSVYCTVHVFSCFFTMRFSVSRCGGLQECRVRRESQAPPRKPSRKCTDHGDRSIGYMSCQQLISTSANGSLLVIYFS